MAGSGPGSSGSAAGAAMKINRRSSAMATARIKGSRHDIDPRLPRRSAPRRGLAAVRRPGGRYRRQLRILPAQDREDRSEEHTSELQSLMRISYAVFCLKKKNNNKSKP